MHKRNKQYRGSHAKGIDVVMAMCDFIECSGNYLETSGSSWQFYRYEPDLINDGSIIDFTSDNNSALFKTKTKNDWSNRK